MKTIIIACGSGIATSTMISANVEEILNDANIAHEIIQCSIPEIESYESRADLIISTSQLQRAYSVPSVVGIGFITGKDSEEAKKEILEILS